MKDSAHHLASSATTGNLVAMNEAEVSNSKNRDIKELYKRSTDEERDGSQPHKKMPAAKSRSQTGTGGNSKR